MTLHANMFHGPHENRTETERWLFRCLLMTGRLEEAQKVYSHTFFAFGYSMMLTDLKAPKDNYYSENSTLAKLLGTMESLAPMETRREFECQLLDKMYRNCFSYSNQIQS